jgi:hypothetical protein
MHPYDLRSDPASGVSSDYGSYSAGSANDAASLHRRRILESESKATQAPQSDKNEPLTISPTLSDASHLRQRRVLDADHRCLARRSASIPAAESASIRAVRGKAVSIIALATLVCAAPVVTATLDAASLRRSILGPDLPVREVLTARPSACGASNRE